MPFGSDPRLNATSNASYSRGPIYAHEPACGKQVTGLRPSAPRAHFGTSTREASSLKYAGFQFKPQ